MTPAVNQIELHPYLQQHGLRREHADRGIVTEAWSPLAKGAVARRAGDHGDRRGARQDARAGRAALAHPARQRRVPEVDVARAARAEHRRVRLRALAPRSWSGSSRSTAASARGRTPTRSTAERELSGAEACERLGVGRARRRAVDHDPQVRAVRRCRTSQSTVIVAELRVVDRLARRVVDARPGARSRAPRSAGSRAAARRSARAAARRPGSARRRRGGRRRCPPRSARAPRGVRTMRPGGPRNWRRAVLPCSSPSSASASRFLATISHAASQTRTGRSSRRSIMRCTPGVSSRLMRPSGAAWPASRNSVCCSSAESSQRAGQRAADERRRVARAALLEPGQVADGQARRAARPPRAAGRARGAADPGSRGREPVPPGSAGSPRGRPSPD